MKVILTIKRPEGHIEEVHAAQFNRMSVQIFEQIKAATAKAGRGEVLSFREEETISAEQLAEIKAADEKAAWFEKHGFGG